MYWDTGNDSFYKCQSTAGPKFHITYRFKTHSAYKTPRTKNRVLSKFSHRQLVSEYNFKIIQLQPKQWDNKVRRKSRKTVEKQFAQHRRQEEIQQVVKLVALNQKEKLFLY